MKHFTGWLLGSLLVIGLAMLTATAGVGGGGVFIPGGGGGGASLPSTTNLIAGNGSGGGIDTGIVPASILTNGPNAVSNATFYMGVWTIFTNAADNSIVWSNGIKGIIQFVLQTNGNTLIPSAIATGVFSNMNAVAGPWTWSTNAASVAFQLTSAYSAQSGFYDPTNPASYFQIYQPLQVTNGLFGSTNGIAVPSGIVGEVIQMLRAVGTETNIVTTIATNIAYVSLTMGDWEVSGNCNFDMGAATVTAMSASIGTTANTVAADGSEVPCSGFFTTTTDKGSSSIPPKKITVTATTTVYLTGVATFSAGTVKGYGQITARRIR